VSDPRRKAWSSELIDPALAAAVSLHATTVRGEGMTGNRTLSALPISPHRTLENTATHNVTARPRPPDCAPLGADIKATPATRVDLRPSLDHRPLAGVCPHRSGKPAPNEPNPRPPLLDPAPLLQG
jgi:hypothetical protein